jgi:hypothetical protein
MPMILTIIFDISATIWRRISEILRLFIQHLNTYVLKIAMMTCFASCRLSTKRINCTKVVYELPDFVDFDFDLGVATELYDDVTVPIGELKQGATSRKDLQYGVHWGYPVSRNAIPGLHCNMCGDQKKIFLSLNALTL